MTNLTVIKILIQYVKQMTCKSLFQTLEKNLENMKFKIKDLLNKLIYDQEIPDDFTLNFDGSNIFPSTQVKNLGITLDHSLTFQMHIDNICFRATNALMRTNRVKQIFKTKNSQQPWFFIFNYCTSIWGLCSYTTLLKAERCQSFAIKVNGDGHYKKYDSVTLFGIDMENYASLSQHAIPTEQ